MHKYKLCMKISNPKNKLFSFLQFKLLIAEFFEKWDSSSNCPLVSCNWPRYINNWPLLFQYKIKAINIVLNLLQKDRLGRWFKNFKNSQSNDGSKRSISIFKCNWRVLNKVLFHSINLSTFTAIVINMESVYTNSLSKEPTYRASSNKERS